jgi:hypothetical protein
MLFRSSGGDAADLCLRAASPVPTGPNPGASGNNLWRRIFKPDSLADFPVRLVLLLAPHYRVD